MFNLALYAISLPFEESGRIETFEQYDGKKNSCIHLGCFFLYRKDMAHSMRRTITDAMNNIFVNVMICKSVNMNSNMSMGATM